VADSVQTIHQLLSFCLQSCQQDDVISVAKVHDIWPPVCSPPWNPSRVSLITISTRMLNKYRERTQPCRTLLNWKPFWQCSCRVHQYKISHGKLWSIDIEVSNLSKCQLTRLLIGWWASDGAYHHMLLHLIYLLLWKKLQSVLNFGQNVSWELMVIYWKSYLLIC